MQRRSATKATTPIHRLRRVLGALGVLAALISTATGPAAADSPKGLPPNAQLTLIAVDADAGAAVFESTSKQLMLARQGGDLAGSGFRLGTVSSTGVTAVLIRPYQGHSLTLQLGLGETLLPEKIVELEEGDRRAAHAMDILARPVMPVVAPSNSKTGNPD